MPTVTRNVLYLLAQAATLSIRGSRYQRWRHVNLQSLGGRISIMPCSLTDGYWLNLVCTQRYRNCGRACGIANCLYQQVFVPLVSRRRVVWSVAILGRKTGNCHQCTLSSIIQSSHCMITDCTNSGVMRIAVRDEYIIDAVGMESYIPYRLLFYRFGTMTRKRQ